MTGRVCEKHQEYSPNGVCRWCEQPTDLVPVTAEQLAHALASPWQHIHAPLVVTGLDAPTTIWHRYNVAVDPKIQEAMNAAWLLLKRQST